MNKYCLPVILPLAMYALTGCQGKDSITPEYSGLDEPATFSVVLNGSPESGSTDAEGLKSLEMLSSDGSMRVPLCWEVSEGIDAGGIVAEGEPVRTKGTQLNPGKNKEPLANYIETVGTTFKAVAFNEGDGNLFIPAASEGIPYASVEYQLGDWKISDGKIYPWPEEERKIFYAYANLPGTGANVGCTYASGETLSYTVPVDARAQKDILLGYYQGKQIYDEVKKKGGIAEITFYHPLTAVKFVKGEFTGMTDVKFRSISISNTCKEGVAVLTPESAHNKAAGDKFAWTPGEGHQNVTLSPKGGESYLEVNAATGVIGGADGTFLLIPQDFTEEPVRITVEIEYNGGTVTSLVSTLDQSQWKAGNTNTYTVGLDLTRYGLFVDGEVETEYNGGNGTYTVTSSAPWKLQYKIGDNDWTDAVAGEPVIIGDELVKFDVVSGGASDTPVDVTATVIEATKLGKVILNYNEVFSKKPQCGSASNPWDLSMHDIFGHSNGVGKATTANCYIISAPGWYAFPMVYGNAVKNGELNKAAYHNTGGSLNNFVKADNAEIPEDAPYVEGATSAYVYWEDVPNYALIPNSSDCVFIVPRSDAASYGLTGCDCDYVVFKTNTETLLPGNALIAVSDGSGILWSWHIWVTDADLTPVRVKNNGTFDGGMMPINLGEVAANKMYEYSGYPKKAVNVRFVQMKGSKVMKEVAKTVVRNEFITNRNARIACRYMKYQWGRKDPFRDSESNYSGNNINRTTGQATIGDAIRNPRNCYYYGNSGTGGNWCSSTYYNLWSAANSVSGNSGPGYSYAPVKTVYDPCPPGYQVPQSDIFSGFSKTTWDTGYSFPTGYDGTIYFRAEGRRNGLSSSSDYQCKLKENGEYGCYWTACANGGSGYCMYFTSNSVTKSSYYGSVNAISVRPVQEMTVIP